MSVVTKYPRIAVITNGNYFAAITLKPTITKYRDQICLGVIITGDYHGRSGWRAVWPLLKEMTFPYFVYKVLTVVLPKLLARLGARDVSEVATLLKQAQIEQISDSKVDAERVRRSLAEARPDIIVSVSCPQKIGGDLISLARRAAINIHSSLLPRYAGLAPYFWVLSRGEAETGVTVHHMTETFDAGNIQTQRRLPVRPGVSAFALFEALARAGGAGLVDAIEAASRCCVGEEQRHADRSYFSHPTFGSYLELRRRGHRLIALSDLSSFLRSAVGGSAAGLRPAQPLAPVRPEDADTGGPKESEVQRRLAEARSPAHNPDQEIVAR
jgi:folate-dependent phosphoribosylglycinamide formyltransferase PurN